MKKKFILILLIITLIFLSSCGSNNQSSGNLLQDFVDSFVLDAEAKNDIELKSSYEYKGATISAIWQSDDEEAIDNTGKIAYLFEDTYATLTGNFSYNNNSISKQFDIRICAKSEDDIFEHVLTMINIPSETNDSIEFISSIKYCGTRFSFTYKSSNKNIIDNSGIIKAYPEKDETVNYLVTAKTSESEYEKEYSVIIKALDKTKFETELNKIQIPAEIKEMPSLPSNIEVDGKQYDILWKTNGDFFYNDGSLKYIPVETEIKFSAILTIINETVSKDFTSIIKPTGGEQAIKACLNDIKIPNIISNDIILPTNLNGVTIAWESNSDAISESGIINKSNKTYKPVKLTATFKAGDLKETHEFDIKVAYEPHMFLDRTFTGTKENVEIKDSKLVLSDGQLTGTYTTSVIEVGDFYEAVGSYSATSSTTETCELKVRLRIGSTWTKYFSYGTFGKGLKNSYSNQTDTLAKMIEDEIKTTGNDANAFQLQLSLKRSNLNEMGPVISLLALAINYRNYNYNVDISTIDKEVKYDVPQLYQHDVPDIGGSICSVTSSTMLLMYKGYDFTGLADYPHQYMAGIVKDYGHNIFGNWSYNCIGMGSFGATSYVKRFINYDELLTYLCYVGPMAASIKGTFVTDKKTYTTGGHLIVLTGYKIENDQIYIYINDPNIYGVSTRCTLDALKNVNRLVSYIVE